MPDGQYPNPRFSIATIDNDPVDDHDVTRKGYVDAQIISIGSVNFVHRSEAGVAGGYATLDGTAHVPTGQIPAIFVLLAQLGIPSGVATLGGDGLVSPGQLPAAATGGLNYKGQWNPVTNVPVLATGGLFGGAATTKGDYVVATATGTSPAIDGLTAWTVGDWAVSTGSAWQKQANSTGFGSMAPQNANAVAITGGSTTGQTVVGYSDGSAVQPGSVVMPDLVWWCRDQAGTIVQALGTDSTTLLEGVYVFGAATFATSVATGGIAFLNGDLEQSSSTAIPDLVRWVRDTAGNIIFGFSETGDTIVQNLQVQGTLTASSFAGGDGGGGTAGPTSPADTLDITDTKYGGVADGNDDVFLGTWTSGDATITLGKYSGTVTWPTSGNTLTLTNQATGVGPGFDHTSIGQYVYIAATDGSGVIATVQITGWISEYVVTVSDNPSSAVSSAIVVWPAFLPTDAGKAIWVEGGVASLNRQAYNSGVQPYLGIINTWVAGNQVTVTGTIIPNFTTSSSAQPCRVAWGTDNSNAYLAVQNDLLALGAKYIWHPRRANQGKTVYCAFKLAQRGPNDNYFWIFVNAVNAVLGATWIGDGSVTGVLTDISGRLMPKRIVPARSPATLHPPRDIIGRVHLPRTGANIGTVEVIEAGDSLAGYNPTGQSGAWYPVNTFETQMRVQNPRKTFHFVNVPSSGLGWSEMVDPSSGLTWVVPGTDLYFMSSSGNNDGWRGHPIKIQTGINLALGSGNDAGGRPPDIILTTGVLKSDAPQANQAWQHDAHLFVETLLRSMARNQGRGLVDLSWQSEQFLHGADNFHRELRQLPQVLAWPISTTPFVMNAGCNSWSAQVKLTAASGGAWAAIGSLRVQLSPMPGNEFILDSDPAGNTFRYEARLWGRSVPTTVTTSGSALTTVPGTASNGTLTWTGGQNVISLTSGGFAGKQGQCILLPGVDLSGQPQRTWLNQVLSDTTAVVDDFWWGNPPGSVSEGTFNDVVNATIGGQQFIPDDARATVDVVMTWGTNSVYRGKITGYTDANTVALTPAPPALTGQAVQMWLGKVSVPSTTTTLGTGGTSTTLWLSLNKDVFGVMNSTTTYVFQGLVERFGCRFYPRFSMTGTGITVTADFTNLYADRDVYFMPAGTPYDLWGNRDMAFSSGGGGGHDTSLVAERLTRPAYEALDLCTT